MSEGEWEKIAARSEWYTTYSGVAKKRNCEQCIDFTFMVIHRTRLLRKIEIAVATSETDGVMTPHEHSRHSLIHN